MTRRDLLEFCFKRKNTILGWWLFITLLTGAAGALTSRAPYDWSDGTSQVLLVVDTDRTKVEALSRLRKELKTAKLKLGGIVLNKREYHIPRFLY